MLAITVLLSFEYTVWAQVNDDPLDSFALNPDFTMSLVAREPIVFDPVDLEFDAHGQAFVVEMPGYPLRDQPGRVVLLTDTDDDGVFDKRTVFADGLPVACSILPYRGGILVASPPDLVFLADRDKDGRAEERTVVISGFPDENTQHNFNGLTHGLDNWIYGANGGNSGAPFWPDAPNDKLNIGWNDFRFDLTKRAFEAIGPSSGGFELTFNSAGQLFETHNLTHIEHLAFPGRYVAGIPNARTLTPIARYAENGLSRIYPIGEQVVRPNHPEQAGYFSAACGITCYTGGAFPAPYIENVFVCDVVLNLVHRMTIHPDGTGLEARRGRDRVEFLASRDRWFRPVNMTVGPDGALYVLDMHREHIEHPEWIPDEMEVEMDLKAGSDQGRIYRIVPKGGLPAATPDFPENDLDTTVSHLRNTNKWWRDTAQRLLVEWKNPAAVSPLRTLLEDHASPPIARVHALWALDGIGSLTEAQCAAALGDPAPVVREQALVAAEQHLEAMPGLLETVLERCSDEDARVRRQAFLCLSTRDGVPFESLAPAFESTVNGGLDDPWMALAMLAAVKRTPVEALTLALNIVQRRNDAGAVAFLSTLTNLAAEADFDRTLALGLKALSTSEYSDEACVAVFDGLAQRASQNARLSARSLQQLDDFMAHPHPRIAGAAWTLADRIQHKQPDLIAGMLARSRDAVLDAETPLAERQAHLELLTHTPFRDRFPVLEALILTPVPAALQEAAMAQLRSEGSTAVATWLIAHWRQLGPTLIRPATDILLYRRENQPLMLQALEDKTLSIGQFNLDLERRRRLLFSKDPDIRTRAERLFSDAGVVTRREAIAAMKPALALAGDVDSGQVIYQTLCAQCHQMGAEGHAVGPNLTEIFRKDKQTLMQDILDPNASVNPQYINYTVVQKAEGDVFADAEAPLGGIIAAEDETGVTLRAAGGLETVYPRDTILSLESSGLSIMPEGLESGMTHQQMADLLAFLQVPR